MLDTHIQNFIEARIEGIHISSTHDYRKADTEKKQAAVALEPFFTDAAIGNRLLNEYDEAAYRQAIVEVEAAYRQGFTDGMKFINEMAAPVGRDA